MKSLLICIVLLAGFVSNAFGQNTHRVSFRGEVSYERHTAWQEGATKYSEVCSPQTGCILGEETPSVARVNFGGQGYEIRKGKLSGKDVYHDNLGENISWDIWQNGYQVGHWEIRLVQILKDGTRIYDETLGLPGVVATATTHIKGMTVIYQSGSLKDGTRFSVKKL